MISKLDMIFEQHKARVNLLYLKLYKSVGILPPIVRWMPRKFRG